MRPLKRGRKKEERIETEVFIEVAREGEKETLLFGLLAPELGAVERDAREREVEDFRAATKDLTRLLVLENF